MSALDHPAPRAYADPAYWDDFRLTIELNRRRDHDTDEWFWFKIGDVMFTGASEDHEELRARYARAYPADYAAPGLQPPFASTLVSVAERTGRALWLLQEPVRTAT